MKSKFVEFLELEVIPVIMANAATILPEFDFRWGREGWVVGEGASQAVLDYFGVRADRIALSKMRPGLFIIANQGVSETYQITAWVLGRKNPPKGDDLKSAILELAKLAGVDASSVDGSKELTAEDRAEIDARRDRLAKEAAELRKQREEQKQREDREAVKAAINLLVRAKQYTDEHGHGLALKYFARRGHKLGHGDLGGLSGSVLCIDDAGIGPKGTGAVIFPVIDEHDKPVGLQRVFVDSMGRPVEVEIKNGDRVTTARKATLGRLSGGRCTHGDGYKDGVCVIAEGGETGEAIKAATGYTVESGISAGGVETIMLRAEDIKAGRIRVIVVAGDLDRSGTGQATTKIAGDRLRAMYKLPVVELLPDQGMVPGLVGDDGLPANDAKSVDFDDVLREAGIETMQDVFDDAIARATVELQHVEKPAGAEDAAEEEQEDADGDGWVQEPTPRFLMAQNDLDCAHEYLTSNHLPEGFESTTIMEMGGRVYRWEDGVWIELGEPKVIRGDIRRCFRKYKIRKRQGHSQPPRFIFPDANLSKSQISAISEAVMDEVSVIVHQDDFRTQFWTRPNIKRNGDFDTDTPSWSRRIEDHIKAGKPKPEMVLSINNGLLNLTEWIEHQDLTPIPHAPDFFTLSKIEIDLPIDEINAILDGQKFEGKDGIEGLRAFAMSMCPEWISFLTMTFMDDEDERAAPATIREVHKLVGYYCTEELNQHQGNLAMNHGPPGTGKSTYLNTIIQVIGERNIVSSNIHKLSNPFHLNSWIGKRLASFSDLDVGARTDKTASLEVIKMVTTGDAMSVDRKHRDEIPNHVLKTRIMANVNQVPQLPDAGNALMRRTLMFDFKRIPSKEQRDPDLQAKLTTPRSRAGILLLGLIGLIDLKTDGGFIQPEWSAGPLEQFADQGSDYPDFIEQCIEITNEKALGDGDYEGDFVSAEDLYDARCGYLSSVGTKHHPKRANMLAELNPILTAHGWQSVNQCQVMLNGKRSAKGYRGFKLTQVGLDFARTHRGSGGDDTGGDQGNSFLVEETT